MKPEEIIKVVQAHIDGKTVQYKHLGEWKKTAFEPKFWDFEGMDYRIKPEPREFYLNIHKDGVIYAHDSFITAKSYLQSGFTTVKVVEVISDE